MRETASRSQKRTWDAAQQKLFQIYFNNPSQNVSWTQSKSNIAWFILTLSCQTNGLLIVCNVWSKPGNFEIQSLYICIHFRYSWTKIEQNQIVEIKYFHYHIFPIFHLEKENVSSLFLRQKSFHAALILLLTFKCGSLLSVTIFSSS